MKQAMIATNRARFEAFLDSHWVALSIYVLVITSFLFDVLFLSKSLSAFDIALKEASWLLDYPYQGVHNLILSDSPFAHYPQRAVTWNEMRSGSVSGFNPYIFTGFAYPAQGIGAFITSLPQLWMSVPEALDWSTWLRLILAAFFMYLLLMDLRLRRAAAIAGGAIWALCMHEIVWLEFPQHLATQLWMPLLLMLNLRLVKGVSGLLDNIVVLLLANVLFITSGYTQIVLYFYAFIGVFNTAYVLTDWQTPIAARMKSWLRTHSVFVLAVVLLAPMLLLDKSIVEAGLRGQQGFRTGLQNITLSWAALPDYLINLVPSLQELKRFYSAPYLGGVWSPAFDAKPFGNVVEASTYFGVLALFFAFYGSFTRLQPLSRALFFSLLLSTLFFWGLLQRDELVVWLVNRVPLFGLGNYSRAITIIVLLLCIMSAVGLSHFLDQLERKRHVLASALFAGFIALPLLADLAIPDLQLRRFAYPYVVLLISAAAVVVLVRHRQLKLVGVLCLFVFILDLVVVGYRFNTRLDNERIFPYNRAVHAMAADEEPFRAAVLADKPLFHPNILSYYKIPVIGGYSTVAPPKLIWFLKYFYGNTHVSDNGIVFLFEGNIKALRLLGVKFIVSNLDIDTSGLEPVQINDAYTLYKMRDPLPRVYCASDLHVWPETSNLVGLFAQALERDDKPVFFIKDTGESKKLTENCEIKGLDVYTNGAHFEVESDEATWLMLPYLHNDAWKVSINRKTTSVEWANGPFMALQVPAGKSHVRMVYDPPLLNYAGMVLVLFGLALVFYALIIPRNKRFRLILIFCGLLTAAQSLFLISGLRNNEIPERVVCDISDADRDCIY